MLQLYYHIHTFLEMFFKISIIYRLYLYHRINSKTEHSIVNF